jgi:hypothetical protein
MIKRSASTETLSDAGPASWSDAGVETTSNVERLSPEQPERGLLWVTRGSLTLTRGGRVHEVRKGTVIAYRIGGGLTWSAPEGTHVRWCAREVGVGPGQVAPWTSELSLDGPVPAAPRRRPLYVVAVVAVAWTFALGVAWCYGTSHATRVAEESQRSRPLALTSPAKDAETARGIFFAHSGVLPTLSPRWTGHKVLFVVDAALRTDRSLLEAAQAAAIEIYQRCPSIGSVGLCFGMGPDGDFPKELGRYYKLPPDGGVLDFRLAYDGTAAPW